MHKVGLVGIILLGVCSSDVSAADTVSSNMPITACVQLSSVALEPILLAQANTPRQEPKPAQRDRDLFAPISERDLKRLIGALTPGKLKDAEGQKIDAFRRRSPLSAQRMGVLMQDVTAILARTHLTESLKRLTVMPDADKAAIGWGQGMVKALDFCLEGRYEPFGGGPVFQDAVTLVLNNRVILEQLVLGNIIPDKVPGGIPGEPDGP